SEIFTLDDARSVESYAAANGIGRISYWATGRDQNPGDLTGEDETYSGVTQQPFDFAHIFAPFGSSTTPPPSPPVATPIVVSGSPDGSAAVFAPGGGGQYNPTPAASMSPFAGFNGEVRSAVADVNGDGIPDTILVTGPGTPLRMAVVSGADHTTLLVAPTAPFAGSEDFTGGGFVSAADLDGDGKAEWAVTPDQGGGPRVTIFSLTNGAATVRANFLGIDDPNFRGGARAALGDVNGDGTPDLAVAAGFLGGPRTALFDGKSLFGTPTRLVSDFFAFPGSDATTLRNGVFVAIGDVDGDGKADLIFGGGPGGSPRVFVLNGAQVVAGDVAGAQAAPIANFFVAGNAADRGGVRVASLNTDGGSRAAVVAGSGEGDPADVRVYPGSAFSGTGEPSAFQDLKVFGGAVLPGGVYVG
ncbi:MAG TPA: FG-GAP-like repeat-containing protein, partial [Urbifossiella sp.]|nr:FG-GAP-like repeat-containing protein [Urbifossiella sp.]